MNDKVINDLPAAYEKISEATVEMQFNMASDLQTGSLLKTLAASKSSGRFLELGTGTGLATSWLAAGMDERSYLLTIDNNSLLIDVARKYLNDNRIEFLLADAYEWLPSYTGKKFDLIFADSMAGKYDLFEEAMRILESAGLYIIDDMLPQPNWPEGHNERVNEFIDRLEMRNDIIITKMNWSTGIILVVKK
jgi:predicted O-methyltransferase YrrM